MFSSCKDVESAEIPKGIEEITANIYDTGKADEFVQNSPTDAIEWLKINCRSASLLFTEFIRKNSHRSLKEVYIYDTRNSIYVLISLFSVQLDLCAVTWGMEPEIVIKMIQDNLRMIPTNNGVTNKQKVELTDAEIIEKLKTPKKPFTRYRHYTSV